MSIALFGDALLQQGTPSKWRVFPAFGRDADGFSVSIEIDPGTSLYGTGEIGGPLLRNGARTEVWTRQPFRLEPDGTVVANYDAASTGLYQAHPWVLAVRHDGSSFGVLAETSSRLEIDLTDGIRLRAAEPFSVIIIEGDGPKSVVSELSRLTGRIELPPHWALGYHQCRFSYYPDSEVRALAEEFRRRAIPCDGIWIDIHYMDAYKVFTFDPERFPNPKETNDYIRELGFHSVWILDPAIKAERGYAVYEEGLAGGHFVTEPQGSPFLGSTWPGDAAFPDYTRPETRAWWGRKTREFLEHGADGLWLDLNEPALILPLGAELPDELRHAGGGDLPPATHATYHNLYGFLMSRATHEAMREARVGKRPFILSRSNYLGGQRYAATWTGDNVSNWTHLAWSVSMVLNLGLSGQPFSGPDIGGFAGTATPELFAHWIGVGALLPFSRTHTGLGGEQEPWSFGADVEATAKKALARRYRLLPYLYTLFEEASRNGLPVARPVFFADPADRALRAEDHAFLLGDDLLVVPRLEPEPGRACRLPKGRWHPLLLDDATPETDPALPALFVRDGAIVPIGQGGRNACEAFEGSIELWVALDESGMAEGRLYEDAGEGHAHLEGAFRLTQYRAERRGGDVEVTVVDQRGHLATTRPKPRVVLI